MPDRNGALERPVLSLRDRARRDTPRILVSLVILVGAGVLAARVLGSAMCSRPGVIVLPLAVLVWYVAATKMLARAVPRSRFIAHGFVVFAVWFVFAWLAAILFVAP